MKAEASLLVRCLRNCRHGWTQLRQQAHVWVRESGHRTSFLSLCSIHSLSLFDTDMICASGCTDHNDYAASRLQTRGI